MVVLVDTSVWIDHFRESNDRLIALLNDGNVFCHPFIIGELACGHLLNRNEILSFLQLLPQSVHAEHEEILTFIENHEIMGKGIGYIDIALLVSSILSEIPLWTLDKRLEKHAQYLSISFQ